MKILPLSRLKLLNLALSRFLLKKIFRFEMIYATSLFKHNYNARAHVIINQGGTSSGKTYAVMQVLFCLACKTAKQTITVVGQDVPNLKAGVLRDALNIVNGSAALLAAVKNYNKSDRVFELQNGSLIEFRSYTDAQDAKSGKRDYLFINEANGIEWNIYTELALRTKTRIFVDYNPNIEFWAHDRLIGKPDVQLIISDHRHNVFLEDHMRIKIESLKEVDIELWKVYARGITGKITGLVLNNWQLCEAIPVDAKLKAIGLDFGFSNDQTGCLAVYMQNGELWLDELIYETEMTNKDISDRLIKLGINKSTNIIADSAEPKSIEELRRLGWRITGAQKGPDSINNSIDILKRYKLNVTRSSINLRRELERYKWKVDKSGKSLNEPVDTWNHLIDPLRYVALNKLRVAGARKTRSLLPYNETKSYNPVENLLT